MDNLNLSGCSIKQCVFFEENPINDQLEALNLKIKSLDLKINDLPDQSAQVLAGRILDLKAEKNFLLSGNSEQIGKGSFSKVYKVNDFALKIVLPDRKIYFDNERKALKELNQRQNGKEYVAKLIAEMILEKQAKEIPALLFTYYPQTLLDFMKRKGNGILALESLVFLEQGLKILIFLKENEVIHLDVKPGNLFLREDGHLVLGDFDLDNLDKRDFSRFRLFSLIISKVSS